MWCYILAGSAMFGLISTTGRYPHIGCALKAVVFSYQFGKLAGSDKIS